MGYVYLLLFMYTQKVFVLLLFFWVDSGSGGVVSDSRTVSVGVGHWARYRTVSVVQGTGHGIGQGV